MNVAIHLWKVTTFVYSLRMAQHTRVRLPVCGLDLVTAQGAAQPGSTAP